MKEAKELTGIASVEEIRAHFPALERRHNGYPVAYFDGPGGTQVPRPVVEAMSDYLYHHNANTHWAYPTSAETDALIESARVALADFFNADSTEIAFGLNMTTLTFHLARALGYTFGAGDEIVVTELDHHGNVAPWHQLAKERGVEIRTVKMDAAAGQLDWPAFEQCVTPRTKLVAVGAASNALGTINDLARAVRMARQVGALVFVDAVHYAPHELVDVRAMDCDFLACSAYKFYGPHIGVLYGRRGLLEALDFPKLLPAPDYAPDRAETGTQNHEGMIGAAAAVDFLASLAAGGTRRERLQSAFAGLHERGVRLLTKLWEGLAAIEGIRLYGPPPAAPRTPTVSFTLAGQPSLAVAEFLAARGLFASNGDFYAWTVVERLGLVEEGLLRVGCACYTTDEEIDRLLEVVRELASGTSR
ncbi:MAG TPA: cysteine desulfurase-like protein [Blastocatellia bacterium]|nr:cysteine desulfurase-like protein [Blastocatellia bacterium]